MEAPAKPKDETNRLRTLRGLDILDTPPEERFDRLTRLARRLFDVPMAMVSLVDEERQWFKSRAGLEATQTPRDVSFCGHTILDDRVFVVPDAAADERFADNPLVTDKPKVRFYAGAPLKAPNGSRVGALCIVDTKPRQMDEDELTLLQDLAHMAEQELAAVQLATLDELTELSNRRGFEILAHHALAVCVRMKRPASMLFLDLDKFKAINDNFGHAEGDRALSEFAALLRENFRSSDVVGRLGGDEFGVLLSGGGLDEAEPALDRLTRAVRAHNVESDRGYLLTYSVGAVPFDPERHSGIDDLMAEADEMMYERKRTRGEPAAGGQSR